MFENETIRLFIFIAVLILMAVAESVFPKRARNFSRRKRWTANLGLTMVNVIVLRLLGPISAVTAAKVSFDNQWGLLHYLSAPLPFYLEVILAIVILDLAIYCQHVVSHKVPILWRLHKVHHADRDIDVSTGVRFHPIEIALSMIYKCGIILLLGPITLAVIIFEVLLSSSAMFNHANLKLPYALDRYLRTIIVTPDFHRVHHSQIKIETNSNYGFFLSCWDRMFKTYVAQPQKGHKKMVIGLSEYQTDKPASLLWSIKLPFYSPEK